MLEAFPVFVVDYECPDGTGQWVKAQGDSRTPNPAFSVEVERQPEGPPFWKTFALNAGAHAALGHFRELERLIFLDADTLIEQPKLFRELAATMPLHQFLMAGRRGGCDVPGLTGVLVVGVDYFVGVEGFDHRFKGWGSEDEDMRLLLLAEGALPAWMPDGLFSSLKHDDSERVRYRVADGFTVHRSWRGSRLERFSKWTQRLGINIRNVRDFPDELQQTIFRPPGYGGEVSG
jgi:glycosyltransferase involved in cell wall biosynthesis